MVVSDIILCISFFFRIAFYKNSNHWKADAPLCSGVLSVAIAVFYVNIYCNMCFLLWTSINRYVTVVQPNYAVLQAFRKPQRCHLLCAATWLLFLVTVSARVGSTIVKTSETIDTCFHLMVKKEPTVSLVFGTMLFFFILGAMLVSYGLLLRHLQKICRSSLMSAWFGPGGGLRVKRKVLASMLVFLACFLPHHIMRSIMLLSEPGNCTTMAQKYSQVKSVTVLVAALNCCLNPILYLVLRSPCCRGKRPKRSPVVTDCSRNQVPQINITEAS